MRIGASGTLVRVLDAPLWGAPKMPAPAGRRRPRPHKAAAAAWRAGIGRNLGAHQRRPLAPPPYHRELGVIPKLPGVTGGRSS